MSKRDEIINYVTKSIHDDMFEEGSIIPSEKALGIKFGCSRLTSRSALTTLVDAGYINARKGKGYQVASFKTHDRFKNLSKRFGSTNIVTRKILDPEALPNFDVFIKHADLLEKYFDIDNTHAFEKKYYKNDKVIIFQITFFNKRIVKKVAPDNINPSIFSFLHEINVKPTKAKEWVFPTEHPYFLKFSKLVGWKAEPFPIMVSTFQNDEDWIEFSIRVVSPCEMTFSKSEKLL